MTIIEILPYLGLFGSIVAFLWGVYQYVDAKRREEQRLRFDQFYRVMIWVSGRTEQGTILVDVQQLSAIYQLSRFADYKDVYVPVLKYLRRRLIADGEVGGSERKDELLRAIDLMIDQKL